MSLLRVAIGLSGICDYDWAVTRENLSSGVGEQQRRRPDCADAQSDQRLFYSLILKYYNII